MGFEEFRIEFESFLGGIPGLGVEVLGIDLGEAKVSACVLRIDANGFAVEFFRFYRIEAFEEEIAPSHTVFSVVRLGGYQGLEGVIGAIIVVVLPESLRLAQGLGAKRDRDEEEEGQAEPPATHSHFSMASWVRANSSNMPAICRL